MSSWGNRQQFKYISVIAIIVLILIAVPIYFIFFNKKPTCFDGIQNQNETGIDCGGVCLKVCEADILNPIVLYSRIVETVPGTYNVVANIENPNPKLYAENVPYLFRVYDASDVLIGERKGLAFIPQNGNFPIFEGTINTGNRLPAKLSFEFSDAPVWRVASTSPPVLNVLNENLSISATSSQRLTADLQNPTPNDIKNIEVVALLYDQDNNLVNASRTVIEQLSKESTIPLVFTWPESFDREVTKIDILPKIPIEDFK